MRMQAEWYIVRDGQPYGPIGRDQLQHMLKLKVVGPADFVWQDGFEDWRRVDSVTELARRPLLPSPIQTLDPGSSPPPTSNTTASSVAKNIIWLIVALSVMAVGGVVGKEGVRWLTSEASSIGGSPAQHLPIDALDLKFIPPSGYCYLEQGQDSELLATVPSATLAHTSNRLLSVSAHCTELRQFRQRQRSALWHYSQYQVVRSMEAKPASAATVRAACEATREQSEKIASDLKNKTQAAFDAAKQNVKVDQMRPMGVLAEEPTACYVGQLQKATIAGATLEIAGVYAITTLKERLIFYYIFAPYRGGQTFPEMLRRHQQNVIALLQANQ
jgi:GYF domain 2